MMALSIYMACVLAWTAVSRATLRWRITSTVPVPDLACRQAHRSSTTGAALSASIVSLLPL